MPQQTEKEKEEHLRVRDRPETIFDLIFQKMSKQDLAKKVVSSIKGEADLSREQIAMTKIVLDEAKRREQTEQEFGINVDAIQTAGRIAMSDMAFLKVLAATLAERRHILHRDPSHIRKDLIPILHGIEESVDHETEEETEGEPASLRVHANGSTDSQDSAEEGGVPTEGGAP